MSRIDISTTVPVDSGSGNPTPERARPRAAFKTDDVSTSIDVDTDAAADQADNYRSASVRIGAKDEPEPVEADPDEPFRILVAGDFSGRSSRQTASPTFSPVRVDRDNFDDVLGQLKPSMNLHGAMLEFRELDDFHPDRLYENTPVFKQLEKMSAALPAAAPAQAPGKSQAAASSGLLDQILAGQSEEVPAPVTAEDATDLPGFIRRVTAGHLVPREDPDQKKRIAKRQEAVSELMRAVLHHPKFQALEAAWQGLFLLVRRLDTDADLHLYILDATLPELVQHAAAIRDRLKKIGRWGLIAGNYSFGQTELDAGVLARLATLAKSLGGPFVSEAQPPGDDDPGPEWQRLRRSPNARWIGLALPRFLLRLPYGSEGASTESFPFEEMPESEHAAYLWGNPAFACAYLLGKSFLSQGWGMQRLERRVENLPMHVYREDGEPVAKPCAEILMTEKSAEALLQAGFMPLASLKHQDTAMIVRFQSIAQPLAPLAGLA